MTLTDVLPYVGGLVTTLVSWEGIRFAFTWRANKIKQKQTANHDEFTYVQQIAQQSSESLILMNGRLLEIVQASADKSKQIDELASSINKVTLENGELTNLYRQENHRLENLQFVVNQLIDLLQEQCECEDSEALKRIINDAQH